MNNQIEEKISKTNQFYTVAVDIGSPKKGRFGWADTNHRSSQKVNQFLEAIKNRTYFSLGIEAPLFLPVDDNVEDFTHSRPFDGKHSWSAGPGACTTAINLGFLARFLRLRFFVENGISVTTDMNVWKARKENCILIWEAFISGNGNGGPKEGPADDKQHIKDAITALKIYESENFIEINTSEYLSLPLAIAKYVGLEVLESPKGIVVIGNKE